MLKILTIFFVATSILHVTETENSNQVLVTKYRNPVQVVVFPFRIKNGKVDCLLMRRIPNRGGFWQGVSGGVEVGENLSQAAARELKEETGFEANVQSINYQFEYPVKEKFRHIYSPDVAAVQEHFFAADVTDLGDPIVSEEHDAFQWVYYDEIDINSLQWEGSKNAIKIANRHIIKEF